MEIILASTSPFRAQQLKDMGLIFKTLKPKINEESLKDLSLGPHQLAKSLAFKKAHSIAKDHFNDIVVGGDQLVVFNNCIYGKSHSAKAALKQLRTFSGHTHQLITSICVIFKGQKFEHTDITELKMKKLSDEVLLEYINENKSWACAGSYKIETARELLFSEIKSNDESAIIGVPTLALKKILTSIAL